MANISGTNSSDLIHVSGDGVAENGTSLTDVPNATNGDDVIYAGNGNDVIRGGGGVDVAHGESGNDVFILLSAFDLAVGETYDGGDGQDWLDGTKVTTAVSLKRVALSDLEVLYGFGAGVSLRSSQLAQFDHINTGKLTLLDGGTVNLLNAFVATKQINLSNAATTLILSLDPESGTSFKGFSGKVRGGAGKDNIEVASAVSDISANAYTLHGGGGDDRINVNAGAARLYGDAGNDWITIGTGTVTARGGSGNDRIDMRFAAPSAVLDGGSGRDTLWGGWMNGDIDLSAYDIRGFETIAGFRDKVSMAIAQFASVTNLDLASSLIVKDSGIVDLSHVHLAHGMYLFFADANDTVTVGAWPKFEIVNFHLGAGDDSFVVVAPPATRQHLQVHVYGEEGNDTIRGGRTDDTLDGGAGDNVLTGSGGSDVFVFSSGNGVITDFQGLKSGQTPFDQIGFRDAISPTRYLGEGDFTAHDLTEVRYDGVKLLVDLDGNGSVDLSVTVTGMTAASQLHSGYFAWMG